MIDRTRTVQELYSAFASGDASTLRELLANAWITVLFK
jgi:ketosteroid isomerase-like protein